VIKFIADDSLVIVYGQYLKDVLDMTSVPSDVHALAWDGTTGEIEYRSNLVPNEIISNLPPWAASLLMPLKAAVDADIAALQAYESSPVFQTDQETAAAYQYLHQTDWIVTRILEAQIKGEDVDALKTQYATELTERGNRRATIEANPPVSRPVPSR
jgi:hypothetical protein